MKVSSQHIKREPGYLYYLGSDGYVWANPMRSNKGGRKHKVGTEKVVREAGYLYYVGKEGYVEKVPQKRGAGKKKKLGAKIIVKGNLTPTTRPAVVPRYRRGKKGVF
jgi:hypothetical protein